MTNYPQMIAVVDHIEPVPRRIRATLAGAVIVDTTRALYVWEWPNYPQYYIPIHYWGEPTASPSWDRR